MPQRLQDFADSGAATADNLRLAAVLSTAVDGILTIDEYGTILTANLAAQRLFGYLTSEMVGNNVNILMPEPYRSRHDGFLAHYRTTGERRIIGIGREVVGRRKDGTTFPMELAVGEAWLPEGRVFTGIIRDITDRKLAEEALFAAKQLLESIVAALPVAVISTDPDGRVRTWNQAAETILGWTSDEITGQPAPVAGNLPTAWGPAQLGYQRKDGTTIDISLISAPLPQGSGRILVIEDVTDRKALETQLHQAQKMEAVGQLTGGLAHDFNNILGIAIGNLDLLAESLVDRPALLDLATAALNSLLKGAELTRQLLAFARRQPLKPVHVQVEEVLGTDITMLRRTLGEQIEVHFRVIGTIWPVTVDIAQLESAITNLAINSRDAMTNGGSLTVTVVNASLDEDYTATLPDVRTGDYVLIEVSDNGPGMPEEVLEHAFEPFFTTKPPGKGTGLGLSMVYGFIKQSGGHIRIYSEVGHGTTVKLYLPRAADGEAHVADRPEPAQGGSETILVVEDNPDVRRVAVRQLRSLGYTTVEAEDARAALDILNGGAAVDLLFTDVVMPHGMSGFDLAREARRGNPALKVLFTSGFPSTSFASAPALDDTTQLLGKPYRKLELAHTVRTVLDTRTP